MDESKAGGKVRQSGSERLLNSLVFPCVWFLFSDTIQKAVYISCIFTWKYFKNVLFQLHSSVNTFSSISELSLWDYEVIINNIVEQEKIQEQTELF